MVDTRRPSMQEITIGRTTARNRVAFVATVNQLGRNDRITAEQIAFYRDRARGGTGLVITEGLSVHPTSIPNAAVPLAYDESLVPGFSDLAAAVKDQSSLLLGQLWHVGRQALWNPNLVPWGPSPAIDPYSGTTPHPMSDADIAEVIEGFVQAARNLRTAGFDGVELHGAHGYLLTQFLSPWSNHRSDRWGGDIQGRTRLLTEIVQAIRASCGKSFIIGLKLSVDEFVPGGLDLAATQEIVAHLDHVAPVDYLAASQANFGPNLDRHVPDLAWQDAPFAYLAEGLRAITDVPVMTLAKVPDLDVADRLLASGKADLVGMSRALLADPDLIATTIAGGQPRPCVYCNECWAQIHSGRPVACFYAPRTGRESRLDAEGLRPASRRSVEVVGAGPAGMEFARIALENGHDVRIHEHADDIGGRLRRDASAAGREQMAPAAQWLEREVRRLGGTIVTGVEVTSALASTWDADAVRVWAAGAEPTGTAPKGMDHITLEQFLEAPEMPLGDVVIDDVLEEEPAYAVACMLAQHGTVHLISRQESIGRRLAYVSRMGCLRRMDQAGVQLHPLTEIVGSNHAELIVEHVFSGQRSNLGPVSTVITAGPYRPTQPPDDGPWLIVGDASSPRGLTAVVREAHDAARSLGRVH